MAAALGAGRGLALRPLNLRDAKALFALVEANRPRLGRWLPWPRMWRRPGAAATGSKLVMVGAGMTTKRSALATA